MDTQTHIRKQYVFEELMNLRDVKNILGVSYALVLSRIREGLLPAYKVTGEPIRCEDVNESMYGLRIRPSDLEDFLYYIKVQ